MSLFSYLNKSIKTRVVFLVTSLLVFSIAVVSIVAILLAYFSMSTQTSAMLTSRSDAISQKIEQRISYLVENIELLSQHELIINSLTDAQGRDNYLPALIENFMLAKDVVSLSIVDFDGRAIFKTQERLPNYNESKSLRNALAMGNTDFYIEEGSPQLVVVSPIEYYGTTQGAAIVVFSLATVIESNSPGNKEIYVALLKDGKKIYSSNFIEGHNYEFSQTNSKNHKSIFYELGLSLELGVDADVYRAPVRDLIGKILLVSFVLLVFGIVLARFLANSIVHPILELHRRVTSDEQTALSFKREDELQELAKAFDKRSLLLRYQAEHDALTSLPNRVFFMTKVKESIELAQKGEQEFALLFLDLDHFKEVNDSFGHSFGDELLIEVSRELRGMLKKGDVIARMGGDEFTLLVYAPEDRVGMQKLLEAIMHFFKKPLNIKQNKFYLTCSIGIALYPVHGDSPELLLKNADAAMYRAKDEGRNTYKFYTDDMTQKAYERITLEKEIREAITHNEFEVYFQPQVDMQTRTILGMEALVRWNHPQKGLVSPALFIPLAEETGLIVDIDKYVMHSAMSAFKKWCDEGYRVGTLSVNLSMHLLNHEGFLEFVEQTLVETKMNPEELMLEVTETQVMINPKNAILVFAELKSLGIRLAVDDFGTGHSSLSYLKELPIDKLKIDQSFTRDVLIDENDAELTRAIISITKSLHLEVIAEGVETEEQKEFLLQNGCREAQGYLYYKPQSTKEMSAIFASL